MPNYSTPRVLQMLQRSYADNQNKNLGQSMTKSTHQTFSSTEKLNEDKTNDERSGMTWKLSTVQAPN